MKQYTHNQLHSMRPWVAGDDMRDIFVARRDRLNGSPQEGDMLDVYPNGGVWLIPAKAFAENYDEVNRPDS